MTERDTWLVMDLEMAYQCLLGLFQYGLPMSRIILGVTQARKQKDALRQSAVI